MFNIKQLRGKKDFRFFILDLIMLFLVVINLLWIIFDWIFMNGSVQCFFLRFYPAFYEFYMQIHRDFMLYDSIFVTIFILELLIQWAIAIKNKVYHKWFFYPFVHWYDVLGCIPIGSFRFLRILRVISITYRLNKLGIVHLQDSYFYKLGLKYLNILVEEVSDRVVVKVLDDVQEEIRSGSPVTDRMISEIILPQREVLANWIAVRLQTITSTTFDNYKNDIRHYVKQLITEATRQNEDIKMIASIPGVGNTIAQRLNNAIVDTIYYVMVGIMDDLINIKENKVIEEIIDIVLENALLEDESGLNQIAKDIVLDAIDLIKEQVKIQQWKLREDKEKEERLQKKLKQYIQEDKGDISNEPKEGEA